MNETSIRKIVILQFVLLISLYGVIITICVGMINNPVVIFYSDRAIYKRVFPILDDSSCTQNIVRERPDTNSNPSPITREYIIQPIFKYDPETQTWQKISQ